jgi:hypothetical protein
MNTAHKRLIVVACVFIFYLSWATFSSRTSTRNS